MDRKDTSKLEEEVNNTIKNILSDITWWERVRFRIYMSINEWVWRYLPMNKIYKTWYMFLIRFYGFKPLKCVNFAGEYTFIFKTQLEADHAFYLLEHRGDRRSLVTGWWYGEKEFEEAEREFIRCFKD